VFTFGVMHNRQFYLFITLLPWFGTTLKYNTWLTRDIKWNAGGFYEHFPDLVENVPCMYIIHMHNNPKISVACSVNPSSALLVITHLLSMSITVTNIVCQVLTWMVFMGVPTAVTYTHISYYVNSVLQCSSIQLCAA